MIFNFIQEGRQAYNMNKALKIFLNIGLALFFVVIFSAEARAEVSAPKIINLTAQGFFTLTGTAPANSDVLIYLDGSFIGRAEAKALTKDEVALYCQVPPVSAVSCQPFWHFQYNPNPKLADGTHLIMAVAQDRTSLVLSQPTKEIKFTINSIPIPLLIAPNEKTATADLRPLIIGLAKDGTLVKIFIDDVFDGQTLILKNESGTANFAYRPTLDLNRGFHKVQAVAEDVSGKTSVKSEAMNFKIELPLPAPLILKSVVNRETSASRPFIVGLSKNDCKIKFFIDNKYNGELTVKNHTSGTANFAYKPRTPLIRGSHSVYAVAVDKRGKESLRSNTLIFSTKNSAIAESAREEKAGLAAVIKEPEAPVLLKPKPAAIFAASGTVANEPKGAPLQQNLKPAPAELKPGPTDINFEKKQKAIKQELEDREKLALEKTKGLAKAEPENSKSDSGMVNEEKQSQGRLKFSIILFILFLLGVVAWLLWVNRELVKERREQNEAKNNEGNLPSTGQNKLL